MLYDKDIREPLAFYLEEIYGKNRILDERKHCGEDENTGCH
jgi:hypothetical protein